MRFFLTREQSVFCLGLATESKSEPTRCALQLPEEENWICDWLRWHFVFANSVEMVFSRQRSGRGIGCGGGEVGGGAPVEQESALPLSFRFQILGARKQSLKHQNNLTGFLLGHIVEGKFLQTIPEGTAFLGENYQSSLGSRLNCYYFYISSHYLARLHAMINHTSSHSAMYWYCLLSLINSRIIK